MTYEEQQEREIGWFNKYEYDMMQDIKQEEEKTGQLSLFDFEGE